MGRINLSARFTQGEVAAISELAKVLHLGTKDLVRYAVLSFTREATSAITADVNKALQELEKMKEGDGEDKSNRDAT